MASNKELTKQAQSLAVELGITLENLPTKNASLAALVSDLKAKKKDADNVTAADGTDEGLTGCMDSDTGDGKDPVDAPPVIPEATNPVIAEGKAITTSRGILGPGDSVSSKDLSGGTEAFDHFVKAGYILWA